MGLQRASAAIGPLPPKTAVNGLADDSLYLLKNKIINGITLIQKAYF